MEFSDDEEEQRFKRTMTGGSEAGAKRKRKKKKPQANAIHEGAYTPLQRPVGTTFVDYDKPTTAEQCAQPPVYD
jgi:hypothetical protein